LSPQNVYPTLSQYIDHDNIPKKYGGSLDFEFGQLPNLEPAIEAQMKWEKPHLQDGRKTFPIGPLKWEEGKDGEMEAWGVGTEGGVQRRELIFTIPKPVGYKQGDVIPPTPAAEIENPLTTTGTATHPPDSEVPETNTPPPDLDSPTTATAPITTTLPIRSGTSEPRLEQQSHTHASGQLADGTPDGAIVDHANGDKSVSVETHTIGQAPKEVPLPDPQTPAPSYLDQAKSVAASASAVITSTATTAAEAVASAVTGKEHEKPTEPVREKSAEEKEMDRVIDATSTKDVETFLRDQTASRGQVVSS
jgi:hypothetical protein